MANDTDETDFPEKRLQEIEGQLRALNERGRALETEASAILTKHLSDDLQRLSRVIDVSASEVAHGTKVIQEAIEKFDASATEDVKKLSGSLGSFQKSLDKSSGQMWWLTPWLVIFTAVLAIFTGMLAFKEVGLLGEPAKTTFLKPPEFRQLNR